MPDFKLIIKINNNNKKNKNIITNKKKKIYTYIK